MVEAQRKRQEEKSHSYQPPAARGASGDPLLIADHVDAHQQYCRHNGDELILAYATMRQPLDLKRGRSVDMATVVTPETPAHQQHHSSHHDVWS